MATIKKYTKKDGSTAWMFNTYLGTDPMTGKQKRTTRRGFISYKEAKLTLARLEVEIEKNGFKKVSIDTFEEVYQLWLDSAYKNTVRESTFVKTKELFINHILPAFGSHKVDKITVKFCQTTVNDWSKRLTKYGSLKNYVSRVLEYAMNIGMVEFNPMQRITTPRRKEDFNKTKVDNFYTKDELQLFLECAKKELYGRWYTFFRLLAFSGMRKGEALALLWSDIDFKNNTVSISKALTRGENKKLIVQPPKTKTSVRVLLLDNVTMNVLREWKSQQATDYLKLGFNTNHSKQPMFTTKNNDYIQSTDTTNQINKVIKAYDLKKITTHGIRHTSCVLLFEAGASIKEVQERLGHSDVQTTLNIYAHITEKAKEETVEKFASYMNF
ncbi:site-specific integrase [Carnobacterium funditum]|uniref:site-specific integrase n=1 Tax=Carnobacterium funditum TaxID=2752 RepID=UPI000559546D|nr:site-specific integrase [Carnobacterium funditum]